MTRSGRKTVKGFQPAQPNVNHLNPIVEEVPVYVTEHQRAQAEFKERQQRAESERFLARSQAGARGSAGSRPFAQEARLADANVYTSIGGTFKEPARLRAASVETLEAYAPPQRAPEVNLWDLAKPGRINKRTGELYTPSAGSWVSDGLLPGYAAEPSRRPNTIDPGLLYGSIDDYVLQELSESLLSQLFPAGDVSSRSDEDSAPSVRGVVEPEEEGWEFAAASEFSFDEVSLVDMRA